MASGKPAKGVFQLATALEDKSFLDIKWSELQAVNAATSRRRSWPGKTSGGYGTKTRAIS